MNKTCSTCRYWKALSEIKTRPRDLRSNDAKQEWENCKTTMACTQGWFEHRDMVDSEAYELGNNSTSLLLPPPDFGCIFHTDKEQKEDKIMKTEISTELLHQIFDMATSMAASGFVVEQRQSCAQQICDSLHPVLFADKEQPKATAPHADESDPYEEQLDREFAVWLTKHNFPADLPEHCLKPLRTAALLVSGFELVKEQSLPASTHPTFPKPGDEELRRFWNWMDLRERDADLESDERFWLDEARTAGISRPEITKWLLERFRRETEQ